MANKNINVGINFTANTSQAQTAIQGLQQTLSQIANGPATSLKIDDASFQKASLAAQQLQQHLNKAYNATTGNIDLSKFNKSLQVSKTNVESLSSNLLAAGDTGKQAFMQLAQGIAQADQPIMTTNKLMGELWTTMKNTMKWQLSSSVLHGFMGAISQAMGYAKSLNASLNDIRIVTGKSSDEMARFAEQANQSAKTLSTSTTDYTRASLIYYQQGLDGKAVQERTDATIKMANVTGDSAEKVSSQMTAIWNNFANGSKSLEYYADVITALGAATASSSAEIAQGLEKFASVANTVGLSYEYATSALATIVATTRQSADTVGTGLRTIFSRLQSLSLGETLDDGVDLTKYSKALETVGVSVLDASGKLRDMDGILNDLANKWDKLDQAQKVALAETVGGVRQYTNLIALMDNWDFMEQNLEVAGGAEGTLTKQQEIYAESWEAASERMHASLEAIFSDIIDDNFFIGITNGFSDVLDGIDKFIDGVGGIKSIFASVGFAILGTVSSQIEPAFERLKYNVSVLTKGATKSYTDFIDEADKSFDRIIKDYNAKASQQQQNSGNNSQQPAIQLSTLEEQQIKNYMTLARVKTEYAKVSDKLTESEKLEAQAKIAIIEKQQKEYEQAIANQAKAQEALDKSISSFKTKDTKADLIYKSQIDALNAQLNAELMKPEQNFDRIEELANEIRNISKSYQAAKKDAESFAQSVAKTVVEIKKLSKEDTEWQTKRNELIKKLQNDIGDQFKSYKVDPNNQEPIGKDTLNYFRNLKNSLGDIPDLDAQDIFTQLSTGKNLEGTKSLDAAAYNDLIDKLIEKLKELANVSENDEQLLKRLQDILQALSPDGAERVKEDIENLGQAEEDTTSKAEKLRTALSKISFEHVASGIESFTKMASGVGQVAMGVKSLNSSFQSFASGDILAGITGITMGLPQIVNGINAISTAIKGAEAAALGWTVVIAAAVAVFTYFQVQAQKTKEAQIEANNKAIEAAQSVREEAEANQELIASLEEAKSALDEATEANENVAEAQERARQAALEAAEALHVQGAAAAAAAGEYEKLIELIRQAQIEENKQGLSDIENGINAAWKNYLLENNNNFISGGYGTVPVDHLVNAPIIQSDEGRRVSEYIQSYAEDSKYIKALENGAFGIYKPENVEEFVEMYQELQKLFNEIGKIDGSETTEYFQNIQDYLNKNQEYYDTISGLQKDQKALAVNTRIYDSNIDRASSYRNYEQNRESNFGEASGLDQEVVDNTLLLNEATRNYEFAYQRFQESGIEDEKVLDRWKELYEIYGDKALQINITPETDDKDIENLFANIQQKADASAIQVRLQLITDLKELAEKGEMDASVWQQAFEKAGLSLFNLGVSDWNEWLSLTSDQQISKLNLAQNSNLVAQDDVNANIYDKNVKEKEQIDAQVDSRSEEAAKAQIESGALDVILELIKLAQNPNSNGSIIKDGAPSDEAKTILNGKDIDYYLGEAGLSDEQRVGIIQALSGIGNLDSVLTGVTRQKEKADSAVQDYNDLVARQVALESEINNYESTKESNWQDNLAAQAEQSGIKMDDIRELAQTYQSLAAADVEGYNDKLANNAEMAMKAAYEALRLQQALDTLNKDFTNYSKVLNSSNKDTVVYQQALTALRKDVANLFDNNIELDGSIFDAAWFEKNMSKIQKAATAGGEAIWELGEEINKTLFENKKSGLAEQLQHMLGTWAGDLYGEGFNTLLNTNGLEDNFTTALNGLQQLADDKTLEVGATLSDSKYTSTIDAFNALMNAGVMSAEEVESAFNNIGWTPEFTYEDIPISAQQAQDIQAGATTEINGHVVTASSLQHLENSSEYVVRVPTINAEKTTKAAPKSATPSGKKGGGGGGKKKDKKLDDERDRYHTVTQQLEDLNNNMDKLGDLSDRAFGAEKLANMQAQVDLYDDLIAKQDQYIDEIKSYLALDTQKLFDLGLNPEFDENGVITNYEEIFDKLVNDYNSGKLDDEAYEERKNAIEQYVESNNRLQKEEAERLGMVNKQKDAWLEMVNTEVELKIDIDADKLKMLEFLLDRLSNDAWDGAERLKNFEQQLDKAVADVATYQQGIHDLIGEEGYNALLSGDMEYLKSLKLDQNTMDQLNEYKDGLLDATKEMLDAQQKMQEQVLNTFKAQDDEVQRAIDGFGNLNSVIEHYNNIVDIVGRGTVGITTDMAKKMRKVQQDNLNNVIASAKTQMEQIATQRAIIEQSYKDALTKGDNGDAIRQLEEQLKEMDDMYNESRDQFLQAWEDALQAAKDIYEATINDIFKDWEKNLSPIYGSLAALSDAFERQKMLDDDYLDDYQKVYELNKLTRDIQSSIDDTDNIAGKKELIDLQNEINELQNSDTEISEYQLEVLQKRFELKKAEIALSETENALNQVRLRQDNEGNWGYVYTADSDAVAEAESEYADKLYELQELNSQYIKDLQDNIVSTQQDMEDELKQLHIEDFDDEAAYYAAKNSIIEDYKKQMNFLFSELAAALENNQNLYDNEMVAYAQMTNTKMIDDDRYLTSFNNTVLSQQTGYETLEEYQGAFTSSTATMADQVSEALEEMQASNEAAFNAAGTAMEGFSDDFEQAATDIGANSEELSDEVDDLAQHAQDAMQAVSDFIDSWKTDYLAAVAEIVGTNETLYESLSKLKQELADYDAEKAAKEQEKLAQEEADRKKKEEEAAAAAAQETNNNNWTYTPPPNNANTPNNTDTAWHTVAVAGPDGRIVKVTTQKTQQEATLSAKKKDDWYNSLFLDTGGYTGRMEYADTGMYTGEWENGSVRSNGRLAWLHQKELVLNAHDTENMLEAVNVVRAITEAINLQALNAAMGLGEQRSAVVQKDPEQLEQTVHITAEFPSVQDRNEIEAAFENLLGKATQFANRRRN